MNDVEIPDVNIANVSTGRIIIDSTNPNRMKKNEFEALKNSIQRFGFVVPVIVNKNYVVADGEHRFRAGRALGMQEIPCAVVDVDEVDRRLIRQVMNKLKGEHDRDLDADDFQWFVDNDVFDDLKDFLPGEDFDWFSPEGFEDSGSVEEDGFEPDLEKPPKYEVVPGDVWQLGRHRLMCGDSTLPVDVEKLMDGKKAHACFTDPPYNINYGNIKHEKFKQREIKNDNMSREEFSEFCKQFCERIKENVKGCVYIAGPPGQDGRIMFSQADNILHNSTTIIWNKDHFTLGRGKYQNKYEPIWFGWVENGSRFTGARNLVNVWDIPRPKKSEEHPTMKPLALMERALSDSTLTEDVVLDLFGSSGSTLIACEQLNRTCYMMELDPKYCSVIIERWEKITNQKALKQ